MSWKVAQGTKQHVKCELPDNVDRVNSLQGKTDMIYYDLIRYYTLL